MCRVRRKWMLLRSIHVRPGRPDLPVRGGLWSWLAGGIDGPSPVGSFFSSFSSVTFLKLSCIFGRHLSSGAPASVCTTIG